LTGVVTNGYAPKLDAPARLDRSPAKRTHHRFEQGFRKLREGAGCHDEVRLVASREGELFLLTTPFIE
jgi:hypothetical protein